MASAVAQSPQLISVEEYLEGERHSPVRHEYVGGQVYAMAGASDDHNRIALNISSALHEQLRGKRCEAFMADMKLKVPASPVFYYPDVLVACDPADKAKYFREKPVVVVEVLSPETERTDQREKWQAYALIPSLKVYVIVWQDQRRVVALRRGLPGPWLQEIITARDGILELPEISVKIPLTRVYERTAVLRRKA